MKRVALLALGLVACIPPVKPPVKPNELDQGTFLSAINAKRATRQAITCTGGMNLGYPSPQSFAGPANAYTWNARLAAAALNNAAFLSSNEVNIATGDPHNGAGNGDIAARALGAGYAFTGIGEAIAAGQVSAEGVADDWQTSTNGHCNLMLDSAMTEMGAAMVTSPTGTRYWVMVVGKPQ
jgi:hypothetical protein